MKQNKKKATSFFQQLLLPIDHKVREFRDWLKKKWTHCQKKVPMRLRRWYLVSKKRHPNANNNRKLSAVLVLGGCVILLSSLIVGRLLYVEGRQRVDGVSLDAQTKSLYQGSKQVAAKRGTIYDRNGVPIAEDATSYSVYAVLDSSYIGINNEKLYVQEDDISKIAQILHRYLNMSESFVTKQIKNGEKHHLKQVEFGTKGKGISIEVRNKIEAALKKEKIKGIYFNTHSDRIYPNGVFASHLIGYTDLVNQGDDSQGLQGVMGIEAAFNNLLEGKNGEEYFQKDVNGNPIPGTIVETKKAVDGKNIYTTLDANLQTYLESLMTKVAKTYTPEAMTAVLMKADTGEILAASQRPTFNPETKAGLQNTKANKGAQWRNLLVQDAYEPGSVMKIFTVAAAIQTGKFNPNAYYQAGSINVDGTTIRDWDYDHPRMLTYAQALSHSSNVGMVKLQQAMGPLWDEYLQKFGFTKTTNSELPGEVSGSMQNGTSVDQAMTAYGQAIAVTNFQMLRAYTAIANLGTMLKPQYISKVVDPNTDKVTETKPEVVGHPISAKTAHEVLNIMQQTIDDTMLGTGTAYSLPNYNSSAKTGTAQIFENGAYSMAEGDYIYSVVQMAPTEHPEYVMYVTLKRPHIPVGSAMSPTKVIASISTPMMERALALDENAAQYKTTRKTIDSSK